MSPPKSCMMPLRMLSMDGLPPPPRFRSDAVGTGGRSITVASRATDGRAACAENAVEEGWMLRKTRRVGSNSCLGLSPGVAGFEREDSAISGLVTKILVGDVDDSVVPVLISNSAFLGGFACSFPFLRPEPSDSDAETVVSDKLAPL